MSKKTLVDDILRSGLVADDVTKLKLKSLSAKQVNTLIGIEVEGYKIPYFKLTGTPSNFYRIKITGQIKEFGVPKKIPRYMQPKDTGTALYLPPYLPWKEIIKDVSVPITFTEGEKKAAKACKSGIPCIGLGGVWAFKNKKNKKRLIDDFNPFIWKGRRVELCFDNDMYTNPKVMFALYNFATELSHLGAEIFLVKLPESKEKIGLDDYLLKKSVKSYYKLEREPFELCEKLLEFNQEIAYVEELGVVYQFNTDMLITSKTQLTQVIYANRTHYEDDSKGVSTLVNTADRWLKWQNRRVHKRFTYLPGQSLVIDNEINRWKGWGVEPKKGTLKPFYQLFNFITKDAEDYFKEWFLQWLAYPLQYPGTKLYNAVVLQSIVQGTGKSFLGVIIGRIYGNNYSKVTHNELHQDFNAWAVDKQFVLGDEVTGTDKRADINLFNDMITRTTITINQKYQPSYPIPDCINYLFTCNPSNGFHIEGTDRRMAVCEITGYAMKDSDYVVIDKWANDDKNIGALFYHLLHEIDVSNFNPKAAPPMTSAKESMMLMSKSDLDTFVYDLRNDPDAILVTNGIKIDRDFYTAAELLMLYDPEGKSRASKTALSRAMSKCPGFRQYLVNSVRGQRRVWAVRNIDYWAKQAPGKKIENYDKSLIGLTDKKVVKFRGKQSEG